MVDAEVAAVRVAMVPAALDAARHALIGVEPHSCTSFIHASTHG
jgi:hypothetical protein